MKKLLKKVYLFTFLFAFVFSTFAPSIYAVTNQDNPTKGDLYIKNGENTYLNEKQVAVFEKNNGLDEDAQGFISVKKTVSEIDKENGKYNVKFEIKGNPYTENIKVDVPIYVVVVFDTSGSMDDKVSETVCKKYEEVCKEYKRVCVSWVGDVCVKRENQCQRTETECTQSETKSDNKYNLAYNGLRDFAKNLHDKVPDAKFSLVSFAGLDSNYYGRNHPENSFDDAKIVGNHFQSYDSFMNIKLNDMMLTYNGNNSTFPYGGTNIQAGLWEASKLLDEIPSKVNGVTPLKYVVVMSDGSPTYYYDNYKTNSGYKTKGSGSGFDSTAQSKAYEQANIIKNKATIYALGYDVGSSGNAFNTLNNIASSYVDENGNNKKHYYSNDNSSEGSIGAAFNKVQDIIAGDSYNSTNAIITDNVGENFTITSNSEIYSVNDLEVKFNPVNVTTEYTEVGSFDVQIDPDSETGWHYTNDGFTLTYTDGQGNNQSLTVGGNGDSETDEPGNNQQVYWVQKEHKYKVEYYYKDTNDFVIDNDLTQIFNKYNNKNIYLNDVVTIDEATQIFDTVHLKDGYEFVNTDPSNKQITIDKDDNKNVIKVYYQKCYTLSIKKTAYGLDNKEEKQREFEFEINLNDSTNNGKLYYRLNNSNDIRELKLVSGKSSFKLKHNDTITFINIKRDTNYSISEKVDNGFTVMTLYNGQYSESKSFNNKLTSNQKLDYLNIAGYELPDTGSTGILNMVIIGTILLLIPVIYRLNNFFKKISC